MTALLWWLVAATRAEGGRDPRVVTIGLVLTGVAVAGSRVHASIRTSVLAWAVTLSVTALLVAVVAPTGWRGAPVAASYVAAGWTAVLVASALRVVRRPSSPPAHVLLASTVALAVAIEFAEAWLPWWGGRSATIPMIGTFYWHDPFAAFMGAGALVSLGLWVQERRLLGALGLVAFLFGTISVAYSTSRAGEAGYALAVGLMTVIAVCSGADRIKRISVALLAAVITVFGVGGPPFFPLRTWFWSGTALRGSGQSLSQNGGYRLQFWREALRVFGAHPLAGGGYHSLATLSAGNVPSDWALSPLAHNGYLQAFSDGGLLLGVPVLAAAAVAAYFALRTLWRATRAHRWSTETIALPLALLFVLGHSIVDFDWSYPTLMVLTAVLGAAVIDGAASRVPEPDRRRGRAGVALTIVGLACAAAAAVGAWHGDLTLNLPVPGHSITSAAVGAQR